MLERLDRVFTRLAGAGLKLKPRKCHLFEQETEYLGHVVSEAGIHVSPNKVKAVEDWPVPQSVTDVRSFLGTAGYYRRSVRNFAAIAAPLHRLTDKDTIWHWEAEHQVAFEHLKEQLCTAPVLQFPVPGARYILDTDASLFSIGAVLSQVVAGEERVLGYASRTLSKAERNYCVTRRELLAVVAFTRHFRPYLYGRQFTIRTDHSSLQWLLSFRDPEGQLARWVQVLQEYDYHIEHRPGVRHGNADGLSRQHTCRVKDCACKEVTQAARIAGYSGDQTPPTIWGQGKFICRQQQNELQAEPRVRLTALNPTWSTADFSAAQNADSDLSRVIKAVEAKVKPTPAQTSDWSRAARRYLLEFDRLRMEGGLLVRPWINRKGLETYIQLVVPRAYVNDVMAMAHDNAVAGHFGVKRTLARLREKYFWSGMDVDVRRWLRSCPVCGARRLPPHVAHHPVQRQQAAFPLQRAAMDILGPFKPATTSGFKYILVMGDYSTKFIIAVGMKDQTSETCAEVFVKHFVCLLGLPETIHSDRGTQFEAALFRKMCQVLGIHKTRTTAFHPQCDGQIERNNRTLLDLLAKLARDNPRDWDEWLPLACFAYNSSVHRVTDETPFRLMMGREATTPLTLMVPSPPDAQSTGVKWADQLRERFERVHALVAERTQHSFRTDSKFTDKRQLGLTFEVGSLVWLYHPQPSRKYPQKVASKWSGPWKVIKVVTTCVYTIQLVGGRKAQTVNVDRLYPYIARPDAQMPPAVGAHGGSARDNVESDCSSGSDNGNRIQGQGLPQDLVPDTDSENEHVTQSQVDTQSMTTIPPASQAASDSPSDNDDDIGGRPGQGRPPRPPTPPAQHIVTRRAQRTKRRPQRLNDYELDDSDD